MTPVGIITVQVIPRTEDHILTMNSAITMTTELEIRYSSDLFDDPEWPLFSETVRTTSIVNSPIGVIEIIAAVSAGCPDLKQATRRASESAVSVLKNLETLGFQTWAFVAQQAWQPSTRMLSDHSMWTDLPLVGMPGAGKRSDEVKFESDDQFRLAALVAVSDKALLEAVQLARNSEVCFLVATGRQDIDAKESIVEMFNYAFPKKKKVAQVPIDWYSLVVGLCGKGDIVIRTSGAFDDPNASVDIFGRSDLLQLSLPKTKSN